MKSSKYRGWHLLCVGPLATVWRAAARRCNLDNLLLAKTHICTYTHTTITHRRRPVLVASRGAEPRSTSTQNNDLTGSPMSEAPREDAGSTTRAKTSLGFNDSRERGRIPPRLAYIKNATYREGDMFVGEQTSNFGGMGLGKSAISLTGNAGVVSPQPGVGASLAPAWSGRMLELLPWINRPAQYNDLEQLLQNVSQKFSTAPKQTWISPSRGTVRNSWSRPSSRGLVRVEGGGEGGSRGGGDSLKEYLLSEEKLAMLPRRDSEKSPVRSQSAQVANRQEAANKPRTLRPIKGKTPKSLDELDLLNIRQSRPDLLAHNGAGATHCSTLQHTATHCSTLQHTATHSYTLFSPASRATNCRLVLSDTHTHTHTHAYRHKHVHIQL